MTAGLAAHILFNVMYLLTATTVYTVVPVSYSMFYCTVLDVRELYLMYAYRTYVPADILLSCSDFHSSSVPFLFSLPLLIRFC